MKILILSRNYPYNKTMDYIFVKQLVDKWVELGYECTVVAPQSLTKVLIRNKNKRPFKTEVNGENNNYLLYSPKYLSFSNLPFFKRIANYLFKRSIMKTLNNERINFDIIYAHFITGPGTVAYNVHKQYQKPYFIALGESTFPFNKTRLIKETILNANGLIAVSSEMKKRILNFCDTLTKDKISVHSNGFNPKLFYPMDKTIIRQELSIEENDFVVCFVGGFINRKGTLRLDKALKLINNSNIKAVFIGEGPQKPDYKYIIHKGPINHKKINKYLNASDVFVLPTLNEGSCNAIVEAIGAGLPVISSNLSFNDDILNESYSIKIDTNSVKEIETAIVTLYNNNELLLEMQKNAIKHSTRFSLDKRALKIINFIKTSVSRNC